MWCANTWTPKESTPVVKGVPRDRKWCGVWKCSTDTRRSVRHIQGRSTTTEELLANNRLATVRHSCTALVSSGAAHNPVHAALRIPQKPDEILKLVPRWDQWFTVRGQCWKIIMLRRNKWATFQVPMGSCLIFTSWRPYNCTKVTRSTRMVQCTDQQHYKPQTASTACVWFPPSLHLANCRNGPIWTTSVSSAFEHVAFMEKWGAARLHSSANIIRVMMIRAGRVARVTWQWPVWRHRRSWDDNIKMGLKDITWKGSVQG